jgi:heat-inducible transcriptional repressor
MVLVSDEGAIENRILTVPPGLSPSALVEATNFINAHLRQGTLADVRGAIAEKRDILQHELDSLTARLVEQGLAISTESSIHQRHLIVRGKANLLGAVTAAEDLERLRVLFSDLETQTDVIELLEQAEVGEGVRIYIGSENRLFSLSGSALIATPFRSTDERVIGVLGVIGPTRLNYARIIPMVDYTARMVAQVLDSD